jgi:hypothetical protein
MTFFGSTCFNHTVIQKRKPLKAFRRKKTIPYMEKVKNISSLNGIHRPINICLCVKTNRELKMSIHNRVRKGEIYK